jgi:hypothetical protein
MVKGNTMNDRKTDNWLYTWLPKIIEIILVVAVIYGGMKVTMANLSADINTLKIDSKEQGYKINTLEANYKNIKETLDRIERKIK